MPGGAAAAKGAPGTYGYCRMPWQPQAARAALHLWEEPCISGESGGSGTVFFSGCTLQCVFCQNSEISCGGRGWPVTAEGLRNVYRNLIAQGAHNINLVTPPISYPPSWNPWAETARTGGVQLQGATKRWKPCASWKAKCRSTCPT